MLDDYRDPEIYGFGDDIIEKESRNYYVYVKTPEGIGPGGEEVFSRKRYKIRASLQVWRTRREYGSEDKPNVSKRDGRLYARYNVKLNEGDVIQKGDSYFKIFDPDDFDNAGIRQYSVARLGYEEVTRYNFEEYQDVLFSEEKK